MSANPFETGERKVIPAVLVYLRQGDRILMLHRNTGNPADYHAGRYNGVGGKCDADEAPRETAAREVAEETGLVLRPEEFRTLGVLQFPNFKAHKAEDWLVYVLTATVATTAQPWETGPEGDLRWVEARDIMGLNLWAGDRHFLPLVLAERPFVGTIWYAGTEVKRHLIEALA